MITIKKIAVTPVVSEGGKIIDSFNANDDKTKNAPSLHATSEEINKVQTASVTLTGTQPDQTHCSLKLDFTRNGKVVTIRGTFTIKNGTAGDIFVNNNFAIPDFAKVTNPGVITSAYMGISSQMANLSGLYAYLTLAFSKFELEKLSNGNYSLRAVYRNVDDYEADVTQALTATYIIE